MKFKNSFFWAIITLLYCMACDNAKNGTEVYRFENGDTSKVYNYKNDNLHGTFKVYHQNGELMEEGVYKHGLRNGVFRSHYENGKISEYRYYKNDSLTYAKRFDLHGQIIDGVIGLSISNDTYQNTLRNGESLTLGYKLPHSMANEVYLGLVVVNINDDKRDTIVDVNSDSNAISYNLTKYDLGSNIYQVTVLEVDNSNGVVIGWQMDTLEFNVMP